MSRYCEIKATSLEQIKETCLRHMKNTRLMTIDMLNEGDLTETDQFYCDMIYGMWVDLHQDVEKMLTETK